MTKLGVSKGAVLCAVMAASCQLQVHEKDNEDQGQPEGAVGVTVQALSIPPAAGPLSPSPLSQPAHAPDRVIVKRRAGVDAARGRAAVPGARPVRSFRNLPRLEVLELPPTQPLQDALAALQADASIEFAEPDYYRYASDTLPDDPKFVQLWGLHNTGQSGGVADMDIDGPQAWDQTTGSDAVVVAVIDSGIDYTHPDLIDNIWMNPGEIAGNGIDDDQNGYVDDIHGIDAVNNDADPMDDHYHGTHCSGTIAARGNNGEGVVGVAWNTKLIGCKFLNANGRGTDSDAIECLDYLVGLKRAGVNVVASNNSWGGGGFSQALLDAIEAGRAEGILFVAAAGNNGQNLDAFEHYPSGYASEAVIAVAAIDHTGSLASFSNYGPTTVDLAAPGVDIYSTLPADGYGYLSGTSMAAPHVTGAVALLAAFDPALTSAELRTSIIQHGKFLESLRETTISGNLLRALSTPPPDDDSDGLPNQWEVDHGLDPFDPTDATLDSDGDGLTNLEEYTARLDPQDPDVDDDGLLDGEELNLYGTKPVDADSDDDGLLDGPEVHVHGTDPLDIDSDDDRLSDGEEVNIHGTDPVNADSDSDGVNDGVEVVMGTDPLSADDVPVVPALRVGLVFHLNDAAHRADVLAKLERSGLVSQVAVVSAFPSLEELQQYDALLVASYHTFRDRAELGDLLADYHDSGGGLVTMAFSMSINNSFSIGGRFDEESYSPLTRARESYFQDSLLVEASDHPIMRGVDGFNGGPVACHHESQLTEGAQLVASWQSGRPLVATKRVRGREIVALNFFPLSDDSFPGQWNPLTDGDLLMANALHHAARPFEDADGDALEDAWELRYGFDPTDASDATADPDGDGLDNLGEFQQATEPHLADSDGDGVGDGDEVLIHGSDPHLVDSDGDSLPDGQEVSLGSDPSQSDPDGDSLSDAQELLVHFTNPWNADSDADGVHDGLELRLGNDPLDADDRPAELPVNVGFVHSLSANYAADVMEKVMASGMVDSITGIDVLSRTPTLGELNQFTAVLVSMLYLPHDYWDLGDVLAAYHDSGAGVVLNLNAFHSSNLIGLRGRLMADGYCPLINNRSVVTGTRHVLEPVDATHPLLAGVVSFDGGSGSYHLGVDLVQGASEIARWSSGFPLVATKDTGGHEVVALNFIPFSSDVCPNCWEASTDGARLMGNALSYVVRLPEVPPAPPPVLCTDQDALAENFDAGLGSFAATGAVAVNNSAGDWPGGDGGNGVAMDDRAELRSAPIDTTDFTALSLSYWMDTDRQDAGEEARVQYCLASCSDEASWVTLVSVPDPTEWTSYTHALPAEAEGITSLQLRWVSDMEGFYEATHVDAIRLQGTRCIEVECQADVDCQDDLFCNGAELCLAGRCEPGPPPSCGDQVCDEQSRACVQCSADSHCDDGLFCNGAERCLANLCQASAVPCASDQVCDETQDLCLDVQCVTDAECDDGLFCNGAERCQNYSCVPAGDPCGGAACDEALDRCEVTCARRAIFADDFESDLSQFSTSGSVSLSTSAGDRPGTSGTLGVAIDDSGNVTTGPLDITNASDLSLSYWMNTARQDAGEEARMQYCVANCGDEANWLTLVTEPEPTPWTAYNHALPAAEGRSSLQLRWVSDMSGFYEYVHLDDVVLEALVCE